MWAWRAACSISVVAAVFLLTVWPQASEEAGTKSQSLPQRSIAVAPGSKVASSDGPCLSFNGLRDATVENLAIGPCAGNGIEFYDSHNVTVRNVVISGTTLSGIYIFGSTSISVEESRITGGASGVYAVGSSSIRVSCNTIENPRGPVPRGRLVQFDKVTGKDNAISCNAGRNWPGQGEPEDAISLYQSRGTPESPSPSPITSLSVGARAIPAAASCSATMAAHIRWRKATTWLTLDNMDSPFQAVITCRYGTIAYMPAPRNSRTWGSRSGTNTRTNVVTSPSKGTR